HSLPTRRSSDLSVHAHAAQDRGLPRGAGPREPPAAPIRTLEVRGQRPRVLRLRGPAGRPLDDAPAAPLSRGRAPRRRGRGPPLIAGLVLAAGLARRMGGGKLVLVLGGRPIVRWSVEALVPHVDDLVVVTGAGGADVRAA